MSSRSQGAEAVHQGISFKDDVALLVENHGFARIQTGDYLATPGRTPAEKFDSAMRSHAFSTGSAFVRNAVVGTDVLCRDLDAHVFLKAACWPTPLALLVFHQEKSGSAKDKIAMPVLSIQRGLVSVPCCFLIEGDGLGDDVKDFLCNEASISDGKIVKVFGCIGDFRKFLATGSRYPAPSLLQ